MMNQRSFLQLVLSCFLVAFLAPAALAADDSPDAKINGLISHVESLSDATFIRNGKEYTSANAAKFLRGKWDANKKDVRTPEDFISKVATKSSTTGKPYVIRFKDGKETPCADYLNARLKKQ
jgi:hypothetical protein